MNAAASVTATFTRQRFTLTVTRSGLGLGTVTSSPAGVNCGGDCSETYDAGTVVVLTATPGCFRLQRLERWRLLGDRHLHDHHSGQRQRQRELPPPRCAEHS